MSDETAKGNKSPKKLFITSLTALGVVFGDIGTSPLYAVRECFHGPAAVPVTPENVLGVLSLIFWSLIIVISINYQLYVLRADNQGEGGILALMALALPTPESRDKRWILALMGVFGTALLYGDGMITPAISVLSAVEGLEIAAPSLAPYVIPGGIGILAGLFLFQRKGTAKVGAVFGPITLVWFVVIAVLGLKEVIANPSVIAALNPMYAWDFFAINRMEGFLILGVVFLVVTGGEALYADMGHFGRFPIRTAWYVVVLPCLLASYFGQGALLLHSPEAASNPFYLLAPTWARFPLIVLATAATVIASQALISGAFSLAMQGMQLGYFPRMKIVYTSAEHSGQIYVPAVNWLLFVAVITLVVGFGSSSGLAAAYGIAVTTTMLITSLLTFVVAREQWRLSLWICGPLLLLFGSIDASFFGANIVKVADGGWMPLTIAAVITVMMTTWRRGRTLVAQRLAQLVVPLSVFRMDVRDHPPTRVPGTAVFMMGRDEGAPPALLHNLKHNKVLHQRVVLLTIKSVAVPHLSDRDRVDVVEVDPDLHRVTAHYGFMEKPEVPKIIEACKRQGLDISGTATTFFVGQQHLIFRPDTHFARWRQALYLWLAKNARGVTDYFELSPNQVVHLGAMLEV
ncbi:MAG: potassium transporter Kup [Deltaproteobacteria bacterium]|nr:potassium transporter Kup [Deltaproteobacteria bacterium]